MKKQAVDTTINHPMRLFMEECFHELLNGSWNREVFIQRREECNYLLDRISHLQLSAVLQFGSDELKAKARAALEAGADVVEQSDRRRANKEINAAIPFAKKPRVTVSPT